MQLKPIQLSLIALPTAFVSNTLWASGSLISFDGRSQLNMTQGVTEISHEIYDLHTAILWICAVIGLIVFGLMFYSMLKHRKSPDRQASTFHESTALEIFWSIIPLVIVVWMAYMATSTLIKTYDSAESILTVKVTGSRWKWHYDYLQYKDNSNINVDFYSNLSTPPAQYENYDSAGEPKDSEYLKGVDNPLVIPSSQKVRFVVTSEDVIHAWWVPDFAIKKDAVPGFINELWTLVPEGKEGRYYGECAELCGKNHAFMPVVVDVVTPDEFIAWIAQQEADKLAAAKADEASLMATLTLDELMVTGEEVYKGKCAVCHGVNGEGGMGPTFVGSDLATNPERKQEHLDILLNGRNIMPSFKAMLSAKELAAVVTFERNAWGNNSGDTIQPADAAK